MSKETRARVAVRKLLHSSSTPGVVLFILASLFVALGTSANFNWNYMVSFINSNIATLCMCIGEAVVIITGGIDISLGGILSLCNVLLVVMISGGMNLALAIVIMLIVAIVAGLINGVMVSVMKVSPLLTTYATSIIFCGLALVVARTPIYLKTSALSAFYKYRLFGAIPMSLFFVLILYIMWKLYKHSPSGIRLYATGENEQSAYASGINVVRSKMLAYSFAGFAAGMGALAVTSMIQGGDPKIGVSMPMTAISAVVIGGVSLSGGRGDVGGSLFGSLFLVMLSNLIVFWGINTFWQELIRTLILLASIVITTLLTTSNRRDRVKKGIGHVQSAKQ
jgi:ribose transport system permease protein